MVTAPVEDPVPDSQFAPAENRVSSQWRHKDLRLGFDVFFGIIAPLLCVYFDPGLLNGNSVVAPHLLGSLRLFVYVEIGLGAAVLAYYLITRRNSSWLAGALFAGALFAFFVGILILPLTLVMLLVLIGIPGLTPFFTGYVFLRNARQCWQQSPAGKHAYRALPVALLSTVLVLGVPLSLQLSANRLVNRAQTAIRTGSGQEFDRALETLRRIRFAVYIDTGRMARDYQRTTDSVLRARLAQVYRMLTGDAIENYLAD
ncbi:MAG TPA: hypothetical protein VF532_07260 [Candidatus Angelobacter sp.]